MRFAQRIDSEIVGLVGPDARRFCNSMFTNNARDLPVGSAQRTAMLDDRGRVVGIMDLYCLAEDRFAGVLDGMTVEAFEERYALYVVLDDVEIESYEDVSVATVQGAEASVPDGLIRLERDRSGLGGFDVVGPTEAVASFVEGLDLPAVDDDGLERLRIRAGSPQWPTDFGDKRLTHEMRMRDAFLHFEKGCYVGQETVNRVDVMGQVKRRLAGLRFSGDAPAGATIHAADKAIGTVTSVVLDDALGRIGLAVLKKPHDADGTEVVAQWDGGSCAATVAELPFPE